MARKKKEESEDEAGAPLYECTIRMYSLGRVEAEFGDIVGLSRAFLNRAVRALFREYHRRRRALVHAQRPKTIEDVERESDQPIRHKDDKYDIEYPAAS